MIGPIQHWVVGEYLQPTADQYDKTKKVNKVRNNNEDRQCFGVHALILRLHVDRMQNMLLCEYKYLPFRWLLRHIFFSETVFIAAVHTFKNEG